MSDDVWEASFPKPDWWDFPGASEYDKRAAWRAAGAPGPGSAANDWEARERAKIEAEVLERKRQSAAKARAEAEVARQQEERAVLSSLLEKAVATDNTAQEIELRLQIARLEKRTATEVRGNGAPAHPPAAIPIGSDGQDFHPARALPSPSRTVHIEQEGHGRLTYFGYNVLAAVILLALSALHPILGVVAALPLHFWNVGQRLKHIGWDSSGGMTLLWMVGFCVPLLNLILGLTLLFTAGRDRASA